MVDFYENRPDLRSGRRRAGRAQARSFSSAARGTASGAVPISRFSPRNNWSYRGLAVSSAAARLAIAGALALALIALALPAHAARVSGALSGYESAAPEANRELHFENALTHDVYLAPTNSDGTFAAELPPGLYHLRAERGVILKPAIAVANAGVALGAVSEAAPCAPWRLWQRQQLAPAQLASPAPATAYLMTADTTVLPPGRALPASEIDWSSLPASAAAAPAAASP
jgi:hypothetical protein